MKTGIEDGDELGSGYRETTHRDIYKSDRNLRELAIQPIQLYYFLIKKILTNKCGPTIPKNGSFIARPIPHWRVNSEV